MMQVGCYSLVIYCDSPTCPHGPEPYEYYAEYTSETGAACRKYVREDGWLLKRNGGAFCPECAGKEKKK